MSLKGTESRDRWSEVHSCFDEVNITTGKIVETIRSPLTLRYVFRDEMEHLLTVAGFRIDTLFGDFKRGPFHAGGEQMWVAGRR